MKGETWEGRGKIRVKGAKRAVLLEERMRNKKEATGILPTEIHVFRGGGSGQI